MREGRPNLDWARWGDRFERIQVIGWHAAGNHMLAPWISRDSRMLAPLDILRQGHDCGRIRADPATRVNGRDSVATAQI